MVEEQLQRGMQALLMHVEQVGSDFSVDVERLEEKTKHAQANTLKLQQSVEKSQGTLAGLVQESEEQIYQQLGPMSERVERMLERQDRMEAGSADALRVVADIGDRVGGVEAELHTRLDSELLYTKRKVEQTHELLSSRIDDEVLVSTNNTKATPPSPQLDLLTREISHRLLVSFRCCRSVLSTCGRGQRRSTADCAGWIASLTRLLKLLTQGWSTTRESSTIRSSLSRRRSTARWLS